ncbi:SRR1-like protein [Halotydeus destructor]|nr:SRR1-like protein [Halotydeus destructor]
MLTSDFNQKVATCVEMFDETAVEVKMNRAIVDLENSSYLKEVKQVILSSCEGSLPRISTIVSYGIGSFTDSVTSRYQLALCLLLKDWLVSESFYAYDPVFSESEKHYLRTRFKCTIITQNEECKRKIELSSQGKTLFFMPHLDKPLYNNLLWANWDKRRLENLLLLGNSFHEMYNYMPSRVFNSEYAFIFNSIQLDILNEKPIDNVFKYNDIFNDFSLHSFCLSCCDFAKFDGVPSTTPVYTEQAEAVFV